MLGVRTVCNVVAISLLHACSGTGGPVVADAPDLPIVDVSVSTDLLVDTSPIEDATGEVSPLDSELTFAETNDDAGGLGCEPGEGCFMDKCTANSQCLSGWCVEHMGAGVCTMQCTEECPAGWSCKAVAGTDPDLVYVCVSNVANLCRPCASGDNCKGVAGNEDVCVDYDNAGSFCGSACVSDDDCPWGFSCQTTTTVDGISTLQCVADAGECPCTDKSVELALWTPCEMANEFGVCAGKRVCTLEGLAPCDAMVAVAESCDAADNDCDGETDEPDLVGGKYHELCDDGNPCTLDTCGGESGCEHVDLDGGECADGDACTVGDHCESGNCTGLPVLCDDDNPCTDDLCDGFGGCAAENNTASCDDGDPCTVKDTCESGQCNGYAVDCECLVDADCQGLDDGDTCNGTLVCDTSKLPHLCVVKAATIVLCPEPTGVDAICLAAHCEPGTGICSMTPANEGFACNDGDKCTVGESCAQGKCGAGVATNCNDGNPCTDDFCDGAAGCLHAANLAPCSDNDACTAGDLCGGSECVAGLALNCDDNNVCTDDGCDTVQGCIHAPNNAPCDLGDACLLGVHCAGGACVFAGVLGCDDGNVCTTDSCLPGAGCSHVNNTLPCSDDSVCTSGDKCAGGQCEAGPHLQCDDGNPCTDDLCSADVGCVHTPNVAPCDLGNECTVGDHCQGGICQFESLLGCDDDNLCTTDFCDPESGCVHQLNNNPCDDEDVCTTGDHCHLGECSHAGTLNCDDGNHCTDDSCSPVAGCSFVYNNAPCNDDNPCTAGEACAQGSCQPGLPVDCDDEAFCNGEESCDPNSGCVAGLAPVTDDGVECTVDSCDEESDVVVHTPDNGLCDNDLFCDGTESCHPVDGCLAGTPPETDDNVGCTVDSCDEANDQAVHTPDNSLCDDQLACNGVETCDPILDCQVGVGENCFFDLANNKILLANNIYIKCFGGLSVNPSTVSCQKPLFNQENYSLSQNSNTMLGLHNEGEQYAAGHKYILEQIGTYIGYAGARTVKMNESGQDNMWSGTGTYQNEHCYANGQVLNWQANDICRNSMGGGSNVLSSFTLSK